jgi:hypothetical protein
MSYLYQPVILGLEHGVYISDYIIFSPIKQRQKLKKLRKKSVKIGYNVILNHKIPLFDWIF